MAVKDSAAVRLAEIAGLLGRPVETFFQPDASGDGSMTHELLRLWCAIRDPQTRQRVLRMIQDEADLCGAVPEAAE